MKNFLNIIILFLIIPVAWAASDENKPYEELTNPQPTNTGDNIEVIELFWYGCPHCYHLEPEVEAWLKTKPEDVTFVRIPAVLGPSWELLARGYYTAELLGILDQTHEKIFERLHKDRKPIRNTKELSTFFLAHGASAKQFDETFKSFAVVTKTNRAKQAAQMYGVHGVPTIVVNGKYRTSPNLAGGNKQIFKVVDELIAKARAEKASTAAAAAAK